MKTNLFFGVANLETFLGGMETNSWVEYIDAPSDLETFLGGMETEQPLRR